MFAWYKSHLDKNKLQLLHKKDYHPVVVLFKVLWENDGEENPYIIFGSYFT